MKAKLSTQHARIASGLDEWGVAYRAGEDRTTLATCSGCNKQVENVVMVGQDPDYESATACLCYACACEAVAAFSNFGEKQVSITNAASMIAPGQEDT